LDTHMIHYQLNALSWLPFAFLPAVLKTYEKSYVCALKKFS